MVGQEFDLQLKAGDEEIWRRGIWLNLSEQAPRGLC